MALRCAQFNLSDVVPKLFVTKEKVAVELRRDHHPDFRRVGLLGCLKLKPANAKGGKVVLRCTEYSHS